MHDYESQQRGKSLSSQEDTRNPTTNKKVIFYTPVQKKSQKRSLTVDKSSQNNVSFQNKRLRDKCGALNNSMYQLRAKKQDCIRSSRYLQAKQLQKTIDSVERKRAKTEFKRLISEHKLQKKVIKKAHIKQMRKFEQVWQNYFIGLRAKQQVTLIHFRKVQQRDIRFVQQQLVDKCKTLKLSTGELKSLEKIERKLQKQQRLEQLIEVKREKKLLKAKLLKQQQEKIYCWAKKEENFLKTFHTKKYNALINRIEELHNDKYRQYQREGLRLRLKYHNVLKKLDHEQKVQLNDLFFRYPEAKSISKGRSLTVGL